MEHADRIRTGRALVLLASSPYPVVSGSKRRSANLALALESDREVILAIADDEASPDAVWAAASRRLVGRRRSRRAQLVDLLLGIVTGRPVLLVRSHRSGLPGAFEKALARERPDLVLLGRPFTAPYAALARRAGARVVVDADEGMPKVSWALARSAHAPLRQRLRAFVEAVTILGRFELETYPEADQIWLSSELERADFGRIVDASRIRVIPNAVDVPPERPSIAPITSVAFIGWYRYPPNEEAALILSRDIMPAVRSIGGPSRLVLIGPDPTTAMVRAAAVGNVHITGNVADPRAELRSAGLLVAPLHSGGGTRVKILEAMACGVPVVSTRLGIEGLGLTDSVHVLVAETPTEFATAITRLATDDDLRARLVATAFDHVRTNHDTPAVTAAVRSALATIRSS